MIPSFSSLHRIRLAVALVLALLWSLPGFSQDLVREAAPPMCTQFVARGSALIRGESITAEFSNHGTISAPGNDLTDVRWRGLGYGYEFGLYVGAEVPGRGNRGFGVPKRDRSGRIARDAQGDTLWVRHIVSEGLLSHGGEQSPERNEWWGWHPVECVAESIQPRTSCFADAVVDETFVMNDLRNREFAYYPLQGDSTWQGLGLEVEARFVQSADPGLQDVVFLMHRVVNRSRVDLDNVVLGMWGDPHIGGARNYQDDLARFVPELGLVEVWDADGIADTPDLIPGYFGFQFLEADSGLTSLTATPFNDLTVANDDQLWDLVRPGRFDAIPNRPGDDVYVFGSGPTRLRVGESIRMSVALLLSETSGGLREKAAQVKDAYDRECRFPEGMVLIDPLGPTVSCPRPEPPFAPVPVECPQDCGCDDPLAVCDEELSCAWMGGPALDPFVTTPSRIHEPLMDAPASVSVVEGERFVRDAGSSVLATLRHTVGVDIAEIGTGRHKVTTRGFNQSSAGNNLLLVDYRQSAIPGLAFNTHGILPVAHIDVAQAEVLRGSASDLYGSHADHGAIHFLTKEPFEYPGTALSGSYGEHHFTQGAVRHAQILSDRFAYKIVGSYSRADDLMLPEIGSDELVQRVQSVEEDMSQGFMRGTLQYRHVPCGCLTVTANADYAGMKQNLLHQTGEMFADYRLSTGQLKVESDAVLAQVYLMKGDTKDAFDYRTGLPITDRSSLFAGQFRYKTDLFDEREHVVVGFDYDRTDSDTGGNLFLTPVGLESVRSPALPSLKKTLQTPGVDYPIHLGRHGRNEADDLVTDLGVYVQSRTSLTPELKLLLAGRLDFSNVIDPQLSPRFGMEYRPSSSHAFRLSFSRGFARPTNLELFADFPAAGSSLFPARVRGNLDGWTFSAPPTPTSLFNVYDLPLRDDGLGMDLDRAFIVATDSLFADGGLLEGWDALEDFLADRFDEIDGISEGVLRYESDPDASTVSNPANIREIEPMVTRSIEIGYKGNFQNRTFVGIDFFYAKTKNHISGLRPITPLVFVPNLPEDLTEEIFRVFTDDELARYKLSRQDLAWLYRTVTESMGRRPAGVVEPEEKYSSFPGPEQLLTWVNYGKADYFGVDLEFRRKVNDWFSYFGNLSWLSDNYFDDEELGESDYPYELALNAPRFKIAAGFDRTFDRRFTVSVAGRYIDSFDVRSGVHHGYVNDYFLLDVGLGVEMEELAPGLRLDVMGINLFDHEHREWVDVAPVGRQVTARLTYTLD